jgi:DNA end-binding protein Ku
MAETKDSTHKVWSGTLAFGLVSAPVAMFAAAREDKISFNQVHPACKSQLKQQPMTCPTCNLNVAKDDIAKGYKVGSQFITFTKEEIKSVEPNSSRILEISDFVPASDVDAVYFESSFFLAVEEGGIKPYALIREAMLLKDMVAIAKLCYSGKEHIAVIRPVPGGLMLHTLFWNYEVRGFQWQRLPEISDKELSIACQLVDQMVTRFDPARYTDEYRANLKQLIERKKAGETIDTADALPTKKPPMPDIADALLASINAAKQSRAMAGGVQ